MLGANQFVELIIAQVILVLLLLPKLLLSLLIVFPL